MKIIRDFLTSIGVRTYWFERTTEQLLTMYKNDLEQYAREKYGIELDRRMTVRNMVADLERQINN